jgi:hypothetical protein
MRTRTRTTTNSVVSWPAGTCSFGQIACSGATNSGTVGYGARTVVENTETETIIDALGRGKVNPVRHTKEYTSLEGNRATTRAYGSTDMGGSVITLSGWPARLGMAADVYGLGSSLLANWSFDSSSINETVMKNDVLERAKGLKADVLLNIVEANQVWPSLKSIASVIPQMASQWRTLRSMIKTASGSFLAWKFGVSPILSDMMSINRYMPILGRDLKRHVDGERSRFSVSRTFPLTYTPGLIAPGGSYFRCTSQGRVLKVPTVRYVLVVEPETRYLTGFFQKLDFVMKRFASSPASLAWEKIPFSFVADWFVDIRGSLNALDNALGYAPYKIVSFSRSYSYAHATDIFGDWISPCTNGVVDSMKAGSYELEYYERDPVSGGSIPTLKNRFGKNQAGISAALIAQQLSKLGAKR